jgi:DNA-3-methyladenine glycosylase
LRLRRLRRSELPIGAVDLARFLIGAIIVRDDASGRRAVRIVETEAYFPGDAAAHAYRGETPRNRSLFLNRGHAYVYFIYGTWFCLNVSAGPAGVGAGVLFRAGEPLAGIPAMERTRRGAALRDLARGPGRLAEALDVTRAEDGLDMCAPGPLWLAAHRGPVPRIGKSVRIGITRDVHRLLRFYERDSEFVSGPRRLNL